jgi:hypothetical protein
MSRRNRPGTSASNGGAGVRESEAGQGDGRGLGLTARGGMMRRYLKEESCLEQS